LRVLSDLVRFLRTTRWSSFFWPLAVATLLALIGLTAFSPSYRHCTEQQYSQAPQQQKSSLNYQAGTVIYCEAVFAQENNGAITAIATIFVALFTLTLWIVTDRAVRLARDEFNASHRPHVRIRAVGFSADQTSGEQFAVKFSCINVGDTPCEIINVRYRIDKAERLHAPTHRMNMDIVDLAAPRALVAGDATSFTTRILTKEGAAELGLEWDIYGFVQYRDGLGVKRISGFWRRYRSSEDLWLCPENPDYNYEY